MPEYRMAWRADLAVCESGHATAVGEPEQALMVLHDRCKDWTWADGNFCIRCGGRIFSAKQREQMHQQIQADADA